MSDEDIRVDTVAPAEGSAGPAVASSFGARLAAAREEAGLSIGEMAGRLRLHVNQVRALESVDLAHLPESAYVRGFVRSYARALNLDPAPLIDDLNARVGLSESSVVDGMTRTRDYSPVRAAAHDHASRSLVLGLAVIALIGLGVIGWYAMRPPLPAAVATGPAAPTAPAPAPAGVTSSEQPAPVVPAAAPAPAPAAAETAEPVAPATEPAPAPSQPVADASALLSLSFSGVSWVEVTDVNGKVLLSQLAREGDVLKPAGGTPPLSVVIGDASKASVTVRGEPFSLEQIRRANVARFSVK
ncbi:MAG TPA: RodZ domain-containing protein [Burkholderiaceae bacterium]|nr:RodZ domain-containing protein [Burkholderiaceae bacterium]